MTRAERIRYGEAVVSDILPACPNCGDLTHLGANYCSSCGNPLSTAKPHRRARATGTTATVTPAYGMRSVSGWGIRGWRAHCPSCGYLSRLYTNVRGCQDRARRHRCEAKS